MANPFLADIQNFSKNRLKKVQTKVLTADGQSLIETKDAQGNIIQMTEDGTIVPSQTAPPAVVGAVKVKRDPEAEKLANGGAEEDDEKAKAAANAVKSGIDRARLDRQASIDAMKSSVSLKNRLAAFGGSGGSKDDEDEAGGPGNRKSPSKISTSKFESGRTSVGDSPDLGAKKIIPGASASVSAVKSKFVKQDKVDESGAGPEITHTKKQWSPPPKPAAQTSAPSAASHHATPSPRAPSAGVHATPSEVEEDAITKRMASGKQCTEVLPGIFMGFRDLKERLPDVSELGVTHILNFLPRLTLDNTSQKEFIYKKVDIPDNPTTDIRSFFPECFEFIERAKAYKSPSGKPGKVLLFCTETEHISSCILIGYLIKEQNKTYKQATDYLQEKRSNIKPSENFSRRLRHFEKDLEDDTLFDKIDDEELERLAKELDSDLTDEEESNSTPAKKSSSSTKTTPSVSPAKVSKPAPTPVHNKPATTTTASKLGATAVSEARKPSTTLSTPAKTAAAARSSVVSQPTPKVASKTTTTPPSRASVSPVKPPATTPSTTAGSGAKPPDKAKKLAQLGGYKPAWG